MSIITMFDYFKQPIASYPLINILYQIRSQKYRKAVMNLRNAFIEDLDAAFDNQKRALFRFSVSGHFKMIKDQLDLISYSGFMILEIPYINKPDLKSVKQKLSKDPYIYACFENALGIGLVFIIKSSVGIDKHAEVFQRAKRYYTHQTGVKRFSSNGESIEHNCMMTIDEKIHINLEAIPFPNS